MKKTKPIDLLNIEKIKKVTCSELFICFIICINVNNKSYKTLCKTEEMYTFKKFRMLFFEKHNVLLPDVYRNDQQWLEHITSLKTENIILKI